MEIYCRKNLNVETEYYERFLWKFTSDAEACARIGSILGKGSKFEIKTLSNFARMFAYNIFLREELRDAFNLEGNLIHRIKYESLPLTVIYSAKASKDAFAEIKNIINKSIITDDDAVKLISFGFETGAYEYVYNTVEANTKKALETISALKKTSAKKELELMINQSLTEIRAICKSTSLYQN